MLALLFLLQIEAAPASLEQILSRVALNQALSQEMRLSYVYTQDLKLKLHRGSGALSREEKRQYTMTPSGRGVTKHLVRLDGRYASADGFVAYDKPNFQYKGVDLDGVILNGFVDDFTNDENSRDGIGHDLFPLTNHQQKKYVFTLQGLEKYQGRDVYRIAFRPQSKAGGTWAGEALIDAAEYQPVFVYTKMARGVPFAVKTLLGSNVRGLGFSITYKKVDDVWFPATYGGEFSLRVLFGYQRRISIDLMNSDFRHTQVDSAVEFEDVPAR